MALLKANSDITAIVDELNQAHLLEKQQIADTFRDALLLLSLTLKPQLINQKAQNYLLPENDDTPFFERLQLYSQKRTSTQFDLKNWLLENKLTQSSITSPLLWLVNPNTATQSNTKYIPVLLQIHKIQSPENKTESLLVVIQDQSLQIQAEAQIKLMEASYAGQFITDSHGYITQPNYAFSAYTGLKPQTLAKMTYIEWLKKQVVFKVPFGSVMEALLTDNCWSGEVQLSPSANTQYHAVLSLSMMTDSNRNIQHFIGVLQDITDIYEAHSKIERLAYYDNLTGLANRTLLNNHLASTHKNITESQSHSGLILIDLDNFKIINDTLGHAVGDQLIILVSQKINQVCSDNQIVVRLDGDEFAVFCKEISQDEDEATTQLLSLAHKIRQTID
ncbi:MAG: sensor domain-containing diguanylate cyclase, partial [Thiomicrorhabdus sp.]|nr:sensor domain-containing diguanylate cyclase [Thiomicrorhabdus sp.]